MPFEFENLELKGVVLVKPRIFGDDRGFFMESYKKSEFEKAGITCDFIQDNHSKSTKGVLRGLHYQAAPRQQAKLVRCIKGKISDVVVDLRKDSSSFGKWLKVELTEENRHMLFIPKGFAHGFVVLSDEAEILYKTDEEYFPSLDRGVLWNDKTLNIDWEIKNPILSEKDKVQPMLSTLNEVELKECE